MSEGNEGHDPPNPDDARWQTFERLLDQMLDDYVHDPIQADHAEAVLQDRAQQLREEYGPTGPDGHGGNR